MLSSIRSFNFSAVIPILCARNSSSKSYYGKDDYIDPDRLFNDKESYRKGIKLSRFGNPNESLPKKGFLPRDPSNKKPLTGQPVYKPKNAWSSKRAFFGQNDYIDILGDGVARPNDSMKGVPAWLRGFQGNEYQMLLLKRQQFHHWKTLRPQKWHDMQLRIKHLYHRLNFKTPS